MKQYLVGLLRFVQMAPGGTLTTLREQEPTQVVTGVVPATTPPMIKSVSKEIEISKKMIQLVMFFFVYLFRCLRGLLYAYEDYARWGINDSPCNVFRGVMGVNAFPLVRPAGPVTAEALLIAFNDINSSSDDDDEEICSSVR